MDSPKQHERSQRSLIDRRAKWVIRVGLPGVATSIVLLLTAQFGCYKEDLTLLYTATPLALDVPLGLPAIESPVDNPLTVEKVALGKRLFFDKNLSLDRSLSCASCHDPEQGWSNGRPVAVGVNGAVGTRNVPTIFNVAFNRVQFWDGRVGSLEAQAFGPILNPVEMAMPSAEAVVERIREDSDYARLFATAFENGITVENIARSLAAFERTILAGNAPYDQYKAGDEQAMSESAKNGLEIFLKKGQCVKCHKSPNFTDIAYHNIGVGIDRQNPDAGRFAVTKLQSNFGAFKSTTLRQLTKTAPYMHDGSLATLEEVVDFYDKGGKPNPQLSRDIRPLRLTKQEKQDLVQFMVEGLSTDDESTEVE